jgi:hypothetical protein
MHAQGETQPQGGLGLRVIRGSGGSSGVITAERPGKELTLPEILRFGTPQKLDPYGNPMDPQVRDWRRSNAVNLGRRLPQKTFARSVAKQLHLPYFWSQLYLRVLKADGREFDLGLVGIHQVTDDGVEFIVDAFAGGATMIDMKFHGIGTGSTAEGPTESALVTELTTEYTTDNIRATGTTAEGASANIYQTVGTNPVDATVALREHGVLDQAAVAGGVLLDRTLYALINLDDGDSLESTYELTLNSGG